jgi:hypothetical protein
MTSPNPPWAREASNLAAWRKWREERLALCYNTLTVGRDETTCVIGVAGLGRQPAAPPAAWI